MKDLALNDLEIAQWTLPCY